MCFCLITRESNHVGDGPAAVVRFLDAYESTSDPDAALVDFVLEEFLGPVEGGAGGAVSAEAAAEVLEGVLRVGT